MYPVGRLLFVDAASTAATAVFDNGRSASALSELRSRRRITVAMMESKCVTPFESFVSTFPHSLRRTCTDDSAANYCSYLQTTKLFQRRFLCEIRSSVTPNVMHVSQYVVSKFIERLSSRTSNALNVLVSSEQVRFKQKYETVCTDGRVPDQTRESSRLWNW